MLLTKYIQNLHTFTPTLVQPNRGLSHGVILTIGFSNIFCCKEIVRKNQFQLRNEFWGYFEIVPFRSYPTKVYSPDNQLL